MKLARYVYLALLVIALLALGVWQLFPGQADADRGESKVPPRFVVDPDWPKQLPKNWLIGQVGGLAVDSHNNIWIIQRPRTLTNDEAGAVPSPPPYFPITTPPTTPRLTPRSDCCVPAPSVMQFDRKGNLLRAWGGPADTQNDTYNATCKAPSCQWPNTEHGIYVDKDDNVWLSGNGGAVVTATGAQGRDDQILKFATDGTFLMQIGKAGASTGNGDTVNVRQPADFGVDDEAHELRSEEHTSELQSLAYLVCRLLLEKKK